VLLMRIFSLLLATVLAMPFKTQAVCLSRDYSLRTEYVGASAVVIAEALSEQIVPDPDDPVGFAATLYKVRIDESIRGSLHGVVELYSENSSGRFPLEIGKKYILFIYTDQGVLEVDNCGNSGPLNEKKEVVAAARELAKSVPNTQKPTELGR